MVWIVSVCFGLIWSCSWSWQGGVIWSCSLSCGRGVREGHGGVIQVRVGARWKNVPYPRVGSNWHLFDNALKPIDNSRVLEQARNGLSVRTKKPSSPRVTLNWHFRCEAQKHWCHRGSPSRHRMDRQIDCHILLQIVLQIGDLLRTKLGSLFGGCMVYGTFR